MPDPRIILQIEDQGGTPPKDQPSGLPQDSKDLFDKAAKGVQNDQEQADATKAAKQIGRSAEGVEGAGATEAAEGVGAAAAGGEATSAAATVAVTEGVGAAFGPVGIALATFAVIVGTAKSALDDLAQAFAQRAKELAPISGPISAAEAMAGVRKLEADMREARATENDLARLVDAQSRTDAMIQDAMRSAQEGGAELSASWAEFKESFTALMVPLMEAIAAVKKFLEGGVSGILDGLTGIMRSGADTAESSRRIARNTQKAEDEFPASFDTILDALDGLYISAVRAGLESDGPLREDFFRRRRERARRGPPPPGPNPHEPSTLPAGPFL